MKKIFFIALCYALVSCAQKQEASISYDATSVSEQAYVPVMEPVKSDLKTHPKGQLIKIVDYRFKVKDVKKTTDMIDLALKRYGAYASSSTMEYQHDYLESKVTIRVPSENLNDLLKEIDAQAEHILKRNISSEDVSKDFVDLESRLRTKREVEARYMEILRKKAGTIEELLDAERQIGALHEEIEATISRINFLKDQVSYSTMNLEYYQVLENPVAVVENPVSGRLIDALNGGLSGLLNVVILLAYMWPLLIAVAVVLTVILYKRKRKAIVV